MQNSITIYQPMKTKAPEITRLDKVKYLARQGKTRTEIAEILGLTKRVINKICLENEIKTKNCVNFWTSKENDIIRENYNKLNGVSICKSLLPNRTLEAIKTRGYILGVSKNNRKGGKHLLSLSDIDKFKKYYKANGRRCFKYFLGSDRTKQNWVQKLNLARPKKVWTDEQIAFLKANFATMPHDELVKHLPYDKRTIANKANKMGIHKDPEILRIMRKDAALKMLKARLEKQNVENNQKNIKTL